MCLPLEGHLQRKLQNARIIRVCNRAKTGRIYAVGWVVVAGVGKIRMVESVEELTAQLRMPALSEREVLEDSHVPIEQPRPDDRALAHIPHRTGGWQRESVGIQPVHARGA